MFYLAIVLTVVSNIFYHVAQKSIPSNANMIVSIIVSYAAALIVSLALLPFFDMPDSFVQSVKNLNWASWLVGITIVGVEIGFLVAYRAGWNISLAALTSNVTLTLMLVPIGLIVFKEHLNWTNLLGVVFCFLGLWLIVKKD